MYVAAMAYNLKKYLRFNPVQQSGMVIALPISDQLNLILIYFCNSHSTYTTKSTSMKLVYAIAIMLTLCACSKENYSTEGNVKVSFYSVGTQYKDSTYYWYLYTPDGYLKNIPLRKGYIGHADSFDNGRANVSIDKLIEGTYIFAYYLNDSLKTNQIQVVAGSTKSYSLTN
jgi:hypothetical protein